MFDKLFKFITDHSEVNNYGFFESKLRIMMEYIATAFDEIDS